MTATGDLNLPVEGHLPSLRGATAWLNSPPLTPEELRGRVVLVDFCTFTCINWLRTVPYVRAWARKYAGHGLVVLGVHTPEFEVEHNLANIRRALAKRELEYPIAVDNDYTVWNAFSNHYWPALYFVDAAGAIRDHHYGEGRYEESERVIQRLLAAAGATGLESGLVSVEGAGAEAPADWDDIRSPETYVGHLQGEGFASPGEPAYDRGHVYAVPDRLGLNQWALEGSWTIGRQTATLNEAGGRIVYRFHARDLHLVLGTQAPGSHVRFRVTIDGEPPGDDHGTDVDGDGNGTVDEPRLYQLVRQRRPVEDRTFAVAFEEPGVQAYVFTFG
jgi:thiol-disulfide isomerase/thioredoxin